MTNVINALFLSDMISSKKIVSHVVWLTVATSVIVVEAGRDDALNALLATGVLTLLFLKNKKPPKFGGLTSSFGGIGNSGLFGSGGIGSSGLYGFGGIGNSGLFGSGGIGNSGLFGSSGHVLPFSHRKDSGLLGALKSHGQPLGFGSSRNGGLLERLAPRRNVGILSRISEALRPKPVSPLHALLDNKPYNIFEDLKPGHNFELFKKGGVPLFGGHDTLLGHSSLFSHSPLLGHNSLLGHHSVFGHNPFSGHKSLLGHGSLFGPPPGLLGSL